MHDGTDGDLLLALTKTRHLIVTSNQFVEVSQSVNVFYVILIVRLLLPLSLPGGIVITQVCCLVCLLGYNDCKVQV